MPVSLNMFKRRAIQQETPLAIGFDEVGSRMIPATSKQIHPHAPAGRMQPIATKAQGESRKVDRAATPGPAVSPPPLVSRRSDASQPHRTTSRSHKSHTLHPARAMRSEASRRRKPIPAAFKSPLAATKTKIPAPPSITLRKSEQAKMLKEVLEMLKVLKLNVPEDGPTSLAAIGELMTLLDPNGDRVPRSQTFGRRSASTLSSRRRVSASISVLSSMSTIAKSALEDSTIPSHQAVHRLAFSESNEAGISALPSFGFSSIPTMSSNLSSLSEESFSSHSPVFQLSFSGSSLASIDEQPSFGLSSFPAMSNLSSIAEEEVDKEVQSPEPQYCLSFFPGRDGEGVEMVVESILPSSSTQVHLFLPGTYRRVEPEETSFRSATSASEVDLAEDALAEVDEDDEELAERIKLSVRAMILDALRAEGLLPPSLDRELAAAAEGFGSSFPSSAASSDLAALAEVEEPPLSHA